MHAYLFVLQAEDGIRDLVRSRGLGDVYKRQLFEQWAERLKELNIDRAKILRVDDSIFETLTLCPVSYTHLTLPTSDLV